MKKLIFVLAMVSMCFSGAQQKWAVRTPIDSETFATISEDFEHFKIHAGKHYFVQDTITLRGVDSAFLFIETPASADSLIHAGYSVSGTNRTTVGFYKDVPRDSIDLTDTIVATNNNFKEDDSTHTFISWGRGDVDSLGTFLFPAQFGASGSFSISQGGSTAASREFVLKNGTGYMIELRTAAGDTSRITVGLSFYEQKD